MTSRNLPPALAAFSSSSHYRTVVQDTLERRESQRHKIAFSDPEKLEKVPHDVVSMAARSAFYAGAAMSEGNSMRNRYGDIVPYDATRVLLANRDPENAYINASWISEPCCTNSRNRKRRWIASQAPIPETVHDFLSMFLIRPTSASVLEEFLPSPSPRVILMLTACKEGGRQKCAQYWPTKVGESLIFEQQIPTVEQSSTPRYRRLAMHWQKGQSAPISVECKFSEPSSKQDEAHHRGWRTNQLEISDGKEKATVYQVEYLGWQDHGVPESSEEVLKLLEHVNSLLAKTSQNGEDTPLVTHCSAGVGRTGAFISIAWLASIMQDLAKGDKTCLSTLREQSLGSPLGALPPMTDHLNAHKEQNGKKQLLPSFLKRDGHPAHNIDNDDQHLDFVMAIIDNLRDQRTTMVQTAKQVEFVYQTANKYWDEVRVV